MDDSERPQTEQLILDSTRRLPRRTFVAMTAAALPFLSISALAGPAPYPASAAGILLPNTLLCVQAYLLCRSKAPAFLLNHSMRTYVFGALMAARHKKTFDREIAFVAALLHDLGLLPEFASKSGPFEIDSADEAEHFVHSHGGPVREGSAIWNAIVMHDMRFAIPSRQSPEAFVVAAGAATDVIGPDDDMIASASLRQVVAAFPRLQFKREFIALLSDHCARKPGAQTGTWLEGYCRHHSVTPASETESAIRNAPFSE